MLLWLDTPVVSLVSTLEIQANQREDDSTRDFDDDATDREEYETETEYNAEDEEEEEEEEERGRR